MPKTLLTLIVMLLASHQAHAGYRGRCLGIDGKQTRCRIEILGDRLKIHMGMKGDLEIRGQDISSLVAEKEDSTEAQKHFLQTSGVSIPVEGITVVVPLASETVDSVLIGLQYEAAPLLSTESQPTTLPTTQPARKQAMMIQMDSKAAAGLKLQLEALTGKKIENR